MLADPPARILVIDDLPANILIIKASLERAGYVILTAASGQEGIDATLRHRPDMILLDIMMPDLDGYEVCRQLKANATTRTIPIAMLTALRERADKVRGLEAGADDFLTKPVDQAELLARVRSLLRVKGLYDELEQRREEVANLNADLERRVAERTAELATANNGLRVAERRASLMAEVGATLATSLDVDAILARLLALLVPRVADWCLVDLLDERRAVRLSAVAHAAPDQTELVRALRGHSGTDPNDSRGLATALRTGQPVIEPAIDLHQHAASRSPEQQALLERLGPRASIIVPLIARGQVIGALTLVASGPERSYGPDELTLAEAVAGRASLAIDNARLYQDARSALQARDTFLSVASHELRTPVTSLKGFVQTLLRYQERGRLDLDLVLRALPLMNRGTDRLTALIDDLLDVSRLRPDRLPLRPRPTDVATLARAIVDRYRERPDGRHRLEIRAADATPMVVADPHRLEQVLINLLDNAIKYSPDGGPIRVAIGADGDGVLVSVEDLGIGLPSGSTEVIFEPFGRAANAEELALPGLGLGLYISRMIIEQHAGRLWAESAAEGQGTTMWLWLPRRLGEADHESVAMMPGADEGGRSQVASLAMS